MHWPQIVMVALFASNFGINVAKHGQPQDSEYSAFISGLGITLVSTILYFGGFWG